MDHNIGRDEEKHGNAIEGITVDSSSEEVPTPSKTGILAKLRGFEAALDRKLGVESQSIQRRLPEDRDPFYARWSSQLVSVPLPPLWFWIYT